MSGFLEMVGRLDDRVNPIVVKELRQAMRGRMIPIMLIIYEAVLLLCMSLYLGSEGIAANPRVGLDLLIVFNSIFLFAGIVLVPISMAVRLGFERNQDNTDLLFITTLPSHRIAGGKLLAGMILTVLFLFATLPFMTTTYMLRGVDFKMVFSMVGTSLMMCMVSLQFALFVAVLPVSRAFKTTLGLGTLSILVTIFISTITIMGNMASRGTTILDQLEEAIGFTVIVVFLTVILYQMAVALIKPHSANRAKPLRQWITVMWFFSGAAVVLTGYSNGIQVWTVFSLITLIIALFVAVSEREEWGPRVRRKIPGSPLGRSMVYLFYSGAPNGVLWCLSLLTVTLIIAANVHSKFNNEDLQIFVGFALHAVGYTFAAHILHHTFLAKRVSKNHVWLIALILLAVMVIGGWVLAFLINPNDFTSISRNGIYHLFNPFALPNDTWRFFYLACAAAWVLIMLAMRVRWLIDGRRRFLPLGPMIPPQPEPAPATETEAS
ncbi:MAG: hypothetical protein QNK37_04410 [Acidobacteriota bacterium]|nr:hypothetical protein [Acidobacteriota bacterium]